MYVQRLVHTHLGPVLAASISVSLHKLCSFDLEGLVFLVSLISSDFYTLSASSSAETPDHAVMYTGSVLDTTLLV